MIIRKGFIISLVLLLWTTIRVGPALAQEPSVPPKFSARIPSLFPESPFLTCRQGHHDANLETSHDWYIRPQKAGALTVDVHAVAVNVIEESGSITARLYDGQTLLGELTVLHPTGQGASNGDENAGALGPVQVSPSGVLRLVVLRGASINTPGEAHHYKLGFSDVGGERVDVGLNSPVFKYLEGEPQVFYVNTGKRENFRLAVLNDSDPQAPQATSATVEIRNSKSGEVVIPQSTIDLPYTLSADNVKGGALVVDISEINGHYRMDKQSGVDRGIYFDSCATRSTAGPFARIPIIDAHSQVDTDLYTRYTGDTDPGDGTSGPDTEIDLILERMVANGVTHTILSPRVNDVHPEELLLFSSAHPDEITQAVVTKGACQKSPTKCEEKYEEYGIPDFDDDSDHDYQDFLDYQIALPDVRAMGEYLSYHAAKGTGAGEVKFRLNDSTSLSALDRALSNGWPFIVHIEFAALERDYGTTDRDIFMADLEDLLEAYPQHPFVMIHMGQLEFGEVRRLIKNHPNIYFLTSHSNPLDEDSDEPWVNMFKGSPGSYFLRSEWESLIRRHPDRFIFAIDNVYFDHWDTEYSQVVSIWRNAFDTLPSEVAHAVAHCNAERLWGLPPQGGPVARIQCVIAEGQRTMSNAGLWRALTASLSASLSSLRSGNNEAARGQLGAFLNKVAAQAGKQLYQADADRLTGMVQGILHLILVGSNYIDTHAHIGPNDGEPADGDYTDGVLDALETMDDEGIGMSILVTGPGQAGLTDWSVIERMSAIANDNPDRFAVMGGGLILGPMINEIAPEDVTLSDRIDFTTLAHNVLQAGNVVGFGEMAALHLQLRDGHPYFSNRPDHPLFLMSIKPQEGNLDGSPNRPIADPDGDGTYELLDGWKRLIEQFPGRFMIGSDAKYEEDKPGRFESIRALLDGLPFNLARQVAYANAYRVYNLRTRLICHDSGPGPGGAMRVTLDQLPGHLAHGDTLGPCAP